EALDEATHPIPPRSVSSNITMPPPKKAPEQAPVSPFSATLADTALRAGIEGLPLSQNPPQERSQAFDDIATAVFSQPPTRQDRVPTDRQQALQEDVDDFEDYPQAVPSQMVQPDEDLPMPVEHLQLPGLREPVPPRGTGSPGFVRGQQPNRSPATP